MTDRDIEKRLRRAIDRTAPDGLDRLLSEVERRKGAVKMTKRRNRWIGLVAAVLALALVGGAGGLYYRQNVAVATVVSLDVNPSIEMNVNRAGKVISCAGLNEEGREILASMNGGEDLKGAKLSVAVNAVVGAIVRAGYLDSLSSAILISVEDDDQIRGERLQAELVAEVDGVLKAAANAAGVLSQNMTTDKALDKQAQENSISSGKAALVNQVIAINPALDFAALSKLSVEELRDLIAIGAPAMPIGRDEAVRKAREDAGLADAASLRYEVDPELDSLNPHYEVELESAGAEYEYAIHAFTGDVLTSAANIPQPPQYQNPNADRVLSAQEAFNAAAERFHTDYPELDGYNIFDIDTEYKTVNNTFEVDFDVAGWDFEYLIDAATGAVVGGHTDYRTPQPSIQDPVPTDPAMPPTQPDEPPTQPDEPPAPSESADIGADAAKAAALQKAGVTDASAVIWTKFEKETDDGRLEYDIEFTYNGAEYDVTVDAATGDIRKYEIEPLPGTLPGNQPDTQPGNQTPAQPADIGEAAAKAAALAKAGITDEASVTWIKCQKDWEDGCYELKFECGATEYECDVRCADGAVTGYSSEPCDDLSHHHGDTHHESPGETAGDIGPDAAAQSALSHAGLTSGDVRGLKTERDWDNGRVVYEVEFRSGLIEYEYKIDAATGAVLEHEAEIDD